MGRHLTKLENHNLKQKFYSEFASGKHHVSHLAKKYGVDRRKLLKWKHQKFGKGNLRQRLIYKMYLVGIPTKAIADFYGVFQTQVNRSIRLEKKILESSQSE